MARTAAAAKTNAEWREQTRKALLKAARREFTAKGYAAAATESVVTRAKLTRGALYYHFKDKRALFLAVFEEIEGEILAAIDRAAEAERDPWRGIGAGLRAFVDACLDPANRRIVLQEAPAVLGWAQWREIDSRYGLGSLKQGLRAAMAAGAIGQQPVEPLAHLLSGAVNELAFMIAEAADPPAARAEAFAALERLLASIR